MLNRMRFSIARILLKGMALPALSGWTRAAFLEPAFDALVREGYQKNIVVAACITALARTFPEPPLLVYADDDPESPPLTDHPLRRLIRRPNPLMSEDMFAQYVIAYMALGGTAYGVAPLSAAGLPVELWPYHAGQVRPVPGGDAWITGYEMLRQGGVWEPIDPTKYLVIPWHWPLPDPEQPWQAQPPLRAAARHVDTTTELDTYIYSVLKNDAVVRGVLQMPPDSALSDPEFNRMRRQWDERYGGENRGKIAILEGGATYQRIALDIQELAADALRGVSEQAIAAAFGVPLSVAGIGDDPTYSNSEEAYRRFTRSTLAPLWRLVAGGYEHVLGSAFGGVVCRHDLDQVVALQEDQQAKWTRITGAFAAGLLSFEEARAQLNYRNITPTDLFVSPISRELLPLAQIIAPPAPLPQQRALPDGQMGVKSKRDAARQARALQRVRSRLVARATPAIERWFDDLAATIVGRAEKRAALPQAKALPSLDDLLTDDDFLSLETVLKSYVVQLVEASWETWNAALDIDVAFELSDPAVVVAQRSAAQRIVNIAETTRDAVRALLVQGAEEGWTIDDLVIGDATRPGLRDLVAQTYRGRARTIARTELGEAQQRASIARFGSAGADRVYVLDNGMEDSDPRCTELNGTVQTLEWAGANTLQHPNCVRCFAPYYGD